MIKPRWKHQERGSINKTLAGDRARWVSRGLHGEQLEPVRRQVALKIIKPGMDTREVIARFFNVQAEQPLLKAYESATGNDFMSRSVRSEAQTALVAVYQAAGKTDLAEEWSQKKSADGANPAGEDASTKNDIAH
jgi:hypothetical protein